MDLDVLISDLGDQMRVTFEADLVYVALHDHETDRIDFAYYSEDGVRRDGRGCHTGPVRRSRMIASREPLLLNRGEQFAGLKIVGTPSASYLGVPIVAGDEAIGVVSVQHISQAGRFGEADKRLLATLAANVGVAIHLESPRSTAFLAPLRSAYPSRIAMSS